MRCLSPVLATLALGATAILTSPASASGVVGPVFERELSGIPVLDAMGFAPNPWQGGWQEPRPQLLDYDADGDLDLFVAEESGMLRHYRNDGDTFTPDFIFTTDEFAGVHELYFTRFVDVDTDGDFDLLVEAPRFEVLIDSLLVEETGAYLFTNTGTPASPHWQNLSPHPKGYLVDNLGDPIAISLTSPDFVDLEGDGDPDLLFGDPSGHIILYRNIGTPTAPSFQFETDSYQDLVIVFGSCNPEEPGPVTLGELLWGRSPTRRHGFMLFNFHDLDGDGKPDLFVGDQYNPNVYHLENLGGSPNPTFVCQTQNFFPAEGGGAGSFPQYLVSTFGDLDGDGDQDALLGSGIDSFTGIVHFRNDGSSMFPNMTLLNDDYLPELDFGKHSAPAFADLDGDLDPDLYVGLGTAQRVAFYENIGSAENAMLAELDPNWMPVPSSSWAVPEFADLDADGDQDFFLGMTSGAVRWFRNDAGAFSEITTDAYFGDSGGKIIRGIADAFSVPRFVNTDTDGDLDLVVGFWDFQEMPTLLHFRNDGTPQVPSFVLASTDYQGLGSMGQNLAPAFGDLDYDGDQDLLVGRFDGTLEFYRNSAGPGAAPVFVIEPGYLDIDVGASSVPYLVDLDDDTDPDLLIGESGGGLNHYRNTTEGTSAVVFSGLTAAEVGTAVRVSWFSTPDADHDGFHVDRATSIDGPWTRRTSELIRGSSPFSWTDPDVLEWATYFYRVVAVDYFGTETRSDPVRVETGERALLRAGLALPRPNPFAAATDIEFVMSRAGRAKVAVFDVTGRRIHSLANAAFEEGAHTVVWRGTDAAGRNVAAGIYFVRFEADGAAFQRKLVKLR